MSYCDGLCPNLNERTHKCKLTGEKLVRLKGWWGTTHEHRGFCERDEIWREGMNSREIAELAVQALEYDKETYIELLQNENYEEIAYLMAEFLVQE